MTRARRQLLPLSLALLATTALLLVGPLGCNIHQEQDELDELMEWSNAFYSMTDDSNATPDAIRGAYARARRLADKVLEREEDNLTAKLIWAFSSLTLGPFSSENRADRTAMSMFAEVLAEEPDNYRAHLGMGLVNFKLSKVKDRSGLDNFSKALRALTGLRALAHDYQTAPAADLEARVATQLELEERHEGFSDDLRVTAGTSAFPYEPFVSLVPDPPGTAELPTNQEVRAAIVERLAGLLDQMGAALAEPPYDFGLYLANLERVETLLRVAHEHYRTSYVAQLDDAIAHFHTCVSLHGEYNRVYHWVYEYLAFSYFLKASSFPGPPIDGLALTPGEIVSHEVSRGSGEVLRDLAAELSAGVTPASTTRRDEGVEPQPFAVNTNPLTGRPVIPTDGTPAATRWALMATVVYWFDQFVVADRSFEQRRREKLAGDDVGEMEANQYWTAAVSDYRHLMRELIDRARIHRRRVIERVIDIRKNELARRPGITPAEQGAQFEASLRQCDFLTDAEWRLTDSTQGETRPFRHHFYRGEIYIAQLLALEEGTPRDPDSGELMFETEGDQAAWRDLITRAHGEYRAFRNGSSKLLHQSMRDASAIGMIMCEQRVPALRTTDSRGPAPVSPQAYRG